MVDSRQLQGRTVKTMAAPGVSVQAQRSQDSQGLRVWSDQTDLEILHETQQQKIVMLPPL